MFTIGNGKDFISFEIAEHYKADVNQPWEEYFLRARGNVSFLSFDKTIEAYRSELERLYNDLGECYDGLFGVCEIDRLSYENDFSIQFEFHKTGRVTVSAKLRSNDEYGNSCILTFDTDQTFVMGFLSEMRATFDFI